MNKLIMFWDCLGINSGQIQVILNMIVIVLATAAALYAKKQIEIAQQQRQDDIRISKHRLKIAILEIAYNCKKDITRIKKDFSDYEVEFCRLLESRNFKIDDIMPGYDYTFKTWLEFPTGILSSIETTITDLVNKLNKNDDTSELSINELEAILIKIIGMTSSLESSKQGIIERINELRTSYALT